MKYSASLSLDCPHCKTNKCHFVQEGNISFCQSDKTNHVMFKCNHCKGKIMIRFKGSAGSPDILIDCFPTAPLWKPKTDLESINNKDVKDDSNESINNKNVKKDFIEAIGCFNHGFYNASMVIARRAIHQEMIKRGLDKKYPKSLYEQLENSGISEKLKELLKKVKNFGNYGAHPDFCLYDENENKLDDIQKFAELSLNFLDKYFSDEYETEAMIKSAPLSQKEVEEQKKNQPEGEMSKNKKEVEPETEEKKDLPDKDSKS